MENDITIKPDLQFSILCDNVRREDNGKMMFIGIFEVIKALSFPVRHHELFIVNRWIKGIGSFVEKTRIIDSNTGNSLIETEVVNFQLKDINHAHTLVHRFVNVVFPGPGKYQVEVLLNNEVIRFYPIILMEERG